MLRALYKYLLAVQLNPFLIYRSIKALPCFWRDRAIFSRKRTDDWPQHLYPILLDRNAQSANLGEYFWQDLY